MNGKRMLAAAFVPALLATSLPAVSRGEAPYTVAWSRQLGTSSEDRSLSVAVDGSGSLYMSGYTKGSLSGTNVGGYDAFLTKYDASGNFLWSRQIGTADDDRSYSVAVDASGNAYISGYTYGSLAGANAGGDDAFLVKYDASGNLAWSRQIGTASWDRSLSVAVDASGNAYASGYTGSSLGGASAGYWDAFLVKYDSLGNLLWSRQIGTSEEDRGRCVTVDVSGNAYISGYTDGSLAGASAGGYDAFLVKYDSLGNLIWSQQIGTSRTDYGWSVLADASGNAYITGRTYGSLGGANAGDEDTFLVKYDSLGNLLWSRQIGTSGGDGGLSLALDASGNVYITGYTDGSLGGSNAGDMDAFLVKYDSLGNLLWSRQIGTLSTDTSYSVAVDASGNAYVSGYTDGSLGGVNAGGYDAFLVKFVVPGPATLSLLALGGLALIRQRRRRPAR